MGFMPFNFGVNEYEHFKTYDSIQNDLEWTHFLMGQSTIQEDLTFYGWFQNYQRLYTQGD